MEPCSLSRQVTATALTIVDLHVWTLPLHTLEIVEDKGHIIPFCQQDSLGRQISEKVTSILTCQSRRGTIYQGKMG
jgi:hypothetical protein